MTTKRENTCSGPRPRGVSAFIAGLLACAALTSWPSHAAGKSVTAETDDIPRNGSSARILTAKTAINDDRTLRRMLAKDPDVLNRADTATLVFTGDMMLHAAQIKAAHARYRSLGGKETADSHRAYDFSLFLKEIRGTLESADIAVANMEFTLGGAPFTGYPAFSAPDSYPEYAAECGIDIFLAANNHICDKGPEGMARTRDRYREMERERGIRFTGIIDVGKGETAAPLYVRAKGLRIAILNFTYGTNAPEGRKIKTARLRREEMKPCLEAAVREADLVIALPHWGTEYSLRHSVSQEADAMWLAENGADIIIGTHPHVVQDCDTLSVSRNGTDKKVPVIYSLGNLISNMSAVNTRIGLILTLKVRRSPDGRAELLAPEFDFTWCALPGRLSDSYQTVPVKDFLGRKDEWELPSDWLNMKGTYERVKRETGITDERQDRG